MKRKHYFSWLILLILLAVSVFSVTAQSPESIITVDNVAELVPAYFLPGCKDISSDSRYIADNTGVYDLATGEVIIAAPPDIHHDTRLSPNGELVSLSQMGLYEVNTGEKRFKIDWTEGWHEPVFSPDNTLINMNYNVYRTEDGSHVYDTDAEGIFSPDSSLFITRSWVYDTETWQHLFGLPTGFNNYISMSTEGDLLAVGHVGVYEVGTWEKRFEISGLAGTFSPDGSMISVIQDGVYDTATGAYLTGRYGTFTPDSQLLIVAGDGVYDTETWEQVYALPGSFFSNVSFTQDGSLMILGNHGIYSVATGERLYDLSAFARDDHHAPKMVFSPDDTFVYVDNPEGNFDTIGCHIFSLETKAWSEPQFGVVRTRGRINVRREPNGPVIDFAEGVLVVVAQSADGWFKTPTLNRMGWIGEVAVDVLMTSEALVVETP